VNYSEILEQQYQYIFFTGSPKVGKEVMSAAADRLIPVSLELGGKSPCFVTKSANVKLAAKRIVWGKLLNAGQTCVAVDYVLVDASRKRELLIAIAKEIQKRYGDPLENPDYPRIISQYHYDRLMGLIALEEMRGPIMGGAGDPATRKIEPCIIPNADWTHTVMREELFGPILPVVAYDNLEEAMEEVIRRPHPLATYIFSEDKEEVKQMLARMPFGGGCVNDVVMHITNHHMPFGGVGNSGMGGYHGRDSFKTFSHEKSIFYGSHVDLAVRYAPLDEKKWNLLKKFLK
jgi:aldehyde dehydrogenase (NAD+)